jgi:hypothetical protein
MIREVLVHFEVLHGRSFSDQSTSLNGLTTLITRFQLS